jgi:hypothetical protein
MRSSGKLAAQVLQYAGTLVKVKWWYFLTSQKDSYLVLYIN